MIVQALLQPPRHAGREKLWAHRFSPRENSTGCAKRAYAAAIGTIANASFLFDKIAITDWLTVGIAAISLLVLFRWKVISRALITAAAAIRLTAVPFLQAAWIFVK